MLYRERLMDRMNHQSYAQIVQSTLMPDRRSGQSTRLVAMYVCVALDNPMLPVSITDHHPTEDADRRLRQMVEDVLRVMNVDCDSGFNSDLGHWVSVISFSKKEDEEPWRLNPFRP